MGRQPITLSSGKIIWPGEDWLPNLKYDQHGCADDGPLSVQEKREYSALAAQQMREGAHHQAVSTQSDPRYDETIDIATRFARPGVLQQADVDPVTYNALYREARERTGPSEEEFQATFDRQEKIQAFEERIESGETLGTNDLAELFDTMIEEKRESGE